jgi:hypothetical protein
MPMKLDKKIIDYKVVWGFNDDQLGARVRKWLRDNWKLYKGFVVHNNTFYQLMIKYEDEDAPS